jgi:serine/threonine protein kinase
LLLFWVATFYGDSEFGYNKVMQKLPCPTCGDLLTPGILCPKDRTAILGPDIRIEKKYTLGAKLGMNNIGEVWSARDANHKILTLRFLRAKLGPESIDRWQSEGRTINQIQHRNLQEIFAFGRLPDKTPYCVAEMLDGESLKSFLEQHKVLPPPWIEHILGQVSRALQAVHERKLAHLNIKPSNIFLVKTRDAHLPLVKILDFGTSHFSEQDANAIFRAPAYLSPEQCAGAKNIDHRSDLYSLGIILFEMLSGQTPFAIPGANAGLIVAQHINGPIPKLSQFTKTKLPTALDKFMAQALAKNPAKRFQSANELYNKFVLALGLPKEPKGKAAPRSIKNIVFTGFAVLFFSILFTATLVLILGSPEAEVEAPTVNPAPLTQVASKPASLATSLVVVPPKSAPITSNIIPVVDRCKVCPGRCIQGRCQTIIAPTPLTCDPTTCAAQGGVCERDACTKPQEPKPPVVDTSIQTKALLEQIKTSILQGDCDSGVQFLADYKKKAGATSDYFWYLAFCSRDNAPVKACKAYQSFLSLSPGGNRATQAKSYMQEKAEAGFEECE